MSENTEVTAEQAATTDETLKIKTPGKGGKKKAATAKVEATADDAITSISVQIENLSKDEAFQLVPELHDSVDQTYFKLGAVFAVIQSNEWHKDAGYDSFKELIENRFGIKYRKAMYLIGIYAALVESGVPYEAFGNIGWTKVKEIAPIVTKANVGQWVEDAKLLTTLQLQEKVKKAQTGTLTKTDNTPVADTGITTFTVKVHKDQKDTIKAAVEKARKEANTEFDGVALEAICLNYLSGAKVAKPEALIAILKKYDAETVLKTFGDAFPEVEITATL